eukprot:Gregarina_sp_Poly_1__5488@NODE_289_length_9981_cov_96_822574_g250_i0_p4_GENE_NODE_289_length_9981_cov_96_822574_g250_i0NODE_289_length_9981_cov_96_822574_g250_i0_p4_ORF_typecomplete_len136_score20_43PhnJ/PF06007_11/0_19_NODE_289_length_9981_cov_96_822574_g250_i023222729
MRYWRLLFFLTLAAAFSLRHGSDGTSSFIDMRSLWYRARSYLSSGAEKKELQFKADMIQNIDKGADDGQAAAEILESLEHPEKYQLTSEQANAIANTLITDNKYQLLTKVQVLIIQLRLRLQKMPQWTRLPLPAP